MRFFRYLGKQLAQLWVLPAGAPVSLLKALQQKICFLSHRRREINPQRFWRNKKNFRKLTVRAQNFFRCNLIKNESWPLCVQTGLQSLSPS
jgi:hypothetical protein